MRKQIAQGVTLDQVVSLWDTQISQTTPRADINQLNDRKS